MCVLSGLRTGQYDIIMRGCSYKPLLITHFGLPNYNPNPHPGLPNYNPTQTISEYKCTHKQSAVSNSQQTQMAISNVQQTQRDIDNLQQSQRAIANLQQTQSATANVQQTQRAIAQLKRSIEPFVNALKS